MRKLTEEQAAKIVCPFTLGSDKLQKCFGKSCFAWTKIDNRIEREDHSGGKEMMHKQAFDREQELKREGPAGSLGVWVLEERGTCGRLTIEV